MQLVLKLRPLWWYCSRAVAFDKTVSCQDWLTKTRPRWCIMIPLRLAHHHLSVLVSPWYTWGSVGCLKFSMCVCEGLSADTLCVISLVGVGLFILVCDTVCARVGSFRWMKIPRWRIVISCWTPSEVMLGAGRRIESTDEYEITMSVLFVPDSFKWT